MAEKSPGNQRKLLLTDAMESFPFQSVKDINFWAGIQKNMAEEKSRKVPESFKTKTMHCMLIGKKSKVTYSLLPIRLYKVFVAMI